jgi:hypothetical protein
MPVQMNLPIRALYEIRGFARPASRPDWRTCKQPESRLIRDHERAKRVRIMRDDALLAVLGMPLRLVLVHQNVQNIPENGERVRLAVRVRGTGGGGC